jgi:hypothetical protein
MTAANSAATMVVPELDCVLYPPFGVGAHTKPEAMTRTPVPVVFDFHSGTPQPLNSALHGCDIRDRVVGAHQDERRWEIAGVGRLPRVGDDSNAWWRKVVSSVKRKAA